MQSENTTRGYGHGDVVVALCWSGDDAPRLYVKEFNKRRGIEGLWSVNGGGKEAVQVDRYEVIAKVVCYYLPPVVLP